MRFLRQDLSMQPRNGPESMILLPQLPQCWVYRYVPCLRNLLLHRTVFLPVYLVLTLVVQWEPLRFCTRALLPCCSSGFKGFFFSFFSFQERVCHKIKSTHKLQYLLSHLLFSLSLLIISFPFFFLSLLFLSLVCHINTQIKSEKSNTLASLTDC